MIGRTFGRWTVIGAAPDVDLHIFLKCRCKCGTVKPVRKSYLTRGRSRSCGCLNREELIARNTVHGMSQTNTFFSWQSMKDRCFNPKNNEWHNYGGRGITVCKRWSESFVDFLSDMGKCPRGYSIERRNVNGNYEPGNCEWIPKVDQARNKRSNVFLTALGRTQLASDWAREIKVNPSHIWYAVNVGKGLEWLLAKRGVVA